MKVVEYLRNTENGLQKLTEEYGIIVKQYPEGLIVLNYDQINSPKQDDMVKECRGLILDNHFNVVSRSFDRFFNYGECFATFDPKTAVAYEKIDGSLIKIYRWNGKWHISTRGTAFAESGVNGFNITFKDMVFKALGCATEEEFQYSCETSLDWSCTYICEVTGVENRVVTRYQGYTLWYLACRDNKSGKYYDGYCKDFGFAEPRTFKFDTIEHCIETVKHLPDLQEGYVIYQDGIPVCKVKSPAYVACHLIRSNTSSPSAFARIALLGDKDEYLAYYPEDSDEVNFYWDKWLSIVGKISKTYADIPSIIDQKSFAEQVKGLKYSWVYFEARKKGIMASDVLYNTEIDRKVKMVLEEK